MRVPEQIGISIAVTPALSNECVGSGIQLQRDLRDVGNTGRANKWEVLQQGKKKVQI